MKNVFLNDDCFNVLPTISAGTIDLIVCDLPYSVTDNSWDVGLPLDRLWAEYKRVLKDGGAIVLTATQPFTSELVMSNKAGFKSEWIWRKDKAVNFLHAKRHPMRKHESVLVFGKNKKGLNTYNPQFTEGKPYKSKSQTNSKNYIITRDPNYENVNTGFRYPVSVQDFPMVKKSIHPTEKPVQLLEFFIKSYSNPGDLVLDNCAGVASTAVACMNTERNYICIEKETEYWQKGVQRIMSAEHAKAI